VDERERNVVKRRSKEAHFPKVKTLEEFDFETASHISSSRLR
jgi:DNA replication protein DnaC